jgi:HEPN domain-containing protein
MVDNLARLTRDWLVKAKHDLQTARIVSATPDGPLDTAIYHCQQAAEKALKGWLA